MASSAVAGRRVDAIIAVKPLALGKRRLSGHLSDADREALILGMLDDVLAAAAAARSQGALYRLWLVGGDARTDIVAARHQARVLRDQSGGLAAAMADSMAVAAQDGAEATLLLPADLPMIDPSALLRLLEQLPQARPALVITPDRVGVGSNALVLAPPLAMPLVFDGRSYAPHCELARQRGLTVVTADIASLRLDVDTPDDLRALAAWPGAALRQSGRLALSWLAGQACAAGEVPTLPPG